MSAATASWFIISIFSMFSVPVFADVPGPSYCYDDGRCLTVVIQRISKWEDAESYCETHFLNGRLASVLSAFDTRIIASWMTPEFVSTDLWTGGFRIGSLPWQWTDGSPFQYTNWAVNEPSVDGKCIEICSTTSASCRMGQWKAVACSLQYQTLCEYGNWTNAVTSTSTTTTTTTPLLSTTTRPLLPANHLCNPGTGKCYYLYLGNMTWFDAETFCETQRYNDTLAWLAAVSDSEDSDLIRSLTGFPLLNGNVWLGASAFGGQDFEWTDHSSWSYTNWAPHQPDLAQGNCLQALNCDPSDVSCTQATWAVNKCMLQQPFVCETIRYTANDCYDLFHDHEIRKSGIYVLSPPGVPPFTTYCDMETDGGGWTVFQKRSDATLMFYNRTWNEYKTGFDNGFTKNFWLGNDNIHALSTKDSSVILRIDIWGDRAPDSSHKNDYWFGEYTFSIDAESNAYTLHISPQFMGNASDPPGSSNGIQYNNGRAFSTFDNTHYGYDCPLTYEMGGWWHFGCNVIALNGKYVPSVYQTSRGFIWFNANVNYINPIRTEMKLRKRA